MDAVWLHKESRKSNPKGFAVIETNSDGKHYLHYILKDHLGSWTTITDAEGTVEQELSFDAWGKRRNPVNWLDTNQLPEPMFDRGFTGHEHLYAFGLINMNGRCYDPVMSSFLSVDAYVQSPDNSQNFNRYSYCLNNPLKYTDPSGEFMYEDGDLVCIFAPFGRIRPMATEQGTRWRTYYSLTDHLGNVRAEFVAHDSGQPELVQQTDYYPFGYTLRRNDFGSQHPNRRLFGGKELQDETLAGNTLDWYDFEARMYDPVIGRFLTTDPMAEKYYSLTPYGYCGNNPINAFDIHGDSISIIHDTYFGFRKETLSYYDGSVFYKDGREYSGYVENYLQSVLDALAELNNTKTGAALISELQNSENMFIIKGGDENGFKPKNSFKSYANIKEIQEITGIFVGSNGSGGTIIWNQTNETSGIDVNGNTTRPAYIGLGHEMAHASDSNKGLLYPSKDYPETNAIYCSQKDGLLKSEWRAVYTENLIRGEANIPLRSHYGVETFGGKNYEIGPRLLTIDNKPINY